MPTLFWQHSLVVLFSSNRHSRKCHSAILETRREQVGANGHRPPHSNPLLLVLTTADSLGNLSNFPTHTDTHTHFYVFNINKEILLFRHLLSWVLCKVIKTIQKRISLTETRRRILLNRRRSVFFCFCGDREHLLTYLLFIYVFSAFVEVY
jgi:hypothetical protein